MCYDEAAVVRALVKRLARLRIDLEARYVDDAMPTIGELVGVRPDGKPPFTVSRPPLFADAEVASHNGS